MHGRWRMADGLVWNLQDDQNGFQQGPSDSGAEAYSFTYVVGSEGARTPLKTVFIILTRKGATGIDGDTEAIGACRAPGDSLNLRENATANQELALAA